MGLITLAGRTVDGAIKWTYYSLDVPNLFGGVIDGRPEDGREREREKDKDGACAKVLWS